MLLRNRKTGGGGAGGFGSDGEMAGTSSSSRPKTLLGHWRVAITVLLPWLLVFILAYKLTIQAAPNSPSSSSSAQVHLASASSSRQCTPEQAALQGQATAVARIRGCPSEDDIWLRFAQLVMPNARTFIDIGSNKGFTAARLFELWSPEMGLDARQLHAAIKRTNPVSKELRECGACNDCRETGKGSFAPRLPRYCSQAAESTSDANQQAALSKQMSSFCRGTRDAFRPISVYSFDGSPHMIDGVTKARDFLAENEEPRTSQLKDLDGVAEDRLPAAPQRTFLAKHWTLEAAAFSSSFVPGKSMRFLVGQGETGHLMADDEQPGAGEEVAQVPILTVDELVRRRSLQHVDVLKIDTEGHDPLVLAGAEQVLREQRVTLVIFEYNKMWDFANTSLKRVLAERITAMGQYACYLEGKNLLLKLTQECWSEELEMRKWSNVWCTSLTNSHGVALAAVFDSYSVAFVQQSA